MLARLHVPVSSFHEVQSAGTIRLDRPIVDSWFIIFFFRGRVHGIILSSHILMPRRNGHAPLSIDGVPIERYTRAHRNGTLIAGRDAYRTKSSHPGVHVDQRTNFKRIQALTPVGTKDRSATKFVKVSDMVSFIRQALVLGLPFSWNMQALEAFRGLQEETAGPLFRHGEPCTPCFDSPGSDCTVVMKVNFFAGATGTCKSTYLFAMIRLSILIRFVLFRLQPPVPLERLL